LIVIGVYPKLGGVGCQDVDVSSHKTDYFSVKTSNRLILVGYTYLKTVENHPRITIRTKRHRSFKVMLQRSLHTIDLQWKKCAAVTDTQFSCTLQINSFSHKVIPEEQLQLYTSGAKSYLMVSADCVKCSWRYTGMQTNIDPYSVGIV